MSTKNKEKPKHLGRGLQSLLGPINKEITEVKQSISIRPEEAKFPPDKELTESLRQIKLTSITPNPYQPRTAWNENDLEELAQSIRVNGIIQPIVVRPNSAGGYELIAGERRFRAAQMTGLEDLPALVRPATDEQMLELALVENIHRTNLNPIERAKAYRKYLQTFSLNQTEAAERLGENRSVVANYLRLLDLPTQIKQMLIAGKLTMGHARAILSLPTDELRQKLANRAMAGRLSVREVERLVRLHLTSQQQGSPKTNAKPAHILDLESKLTRHLGTKVNIDARKNGQRGKISIEFCSLDEFDRIADKIGLSTLEEV